jgi:hypothetical protein
MPGTGRTVTESTDAELEDEEPPLYDADDDDDSDREGN